MKKVYLLRVVAMAISAALLTAVFEPFNETASLVFALSPMLLLSRHSSPSKACIYWFLCGFAFWFATLSWFPAVVKNNGPLPLVLLGWAGLSAVCSGYFALFGALHAAMWRATAGGRLRLGALIVGEPILWAGCEWLRATLFTGFAWNFLGGALSKIPALAAPASIGGVYLASAAVILVNGVFATLGERALAPFLQDSSKTGRWMKSFETAIPLLVVILLVRLAPTPSVSSIFPLRVALVQRNAPCIFSSADRDDPHAVFGELLERTAPAAPHLAVLAESAISEFGRGGVRGTAARSAAKELIGKANASALLAGGDDYETVDSTRRTYNAAALYLPDGSVSDVYHKQHLVPCGEYIFFDKWIPALQKLSPIGVSCWPGETKVMELPLKDASIRIAPIICYEDTDPVLSRKAANAGASAIVLITNDSWFSHSNEAVQHASQAVMRAIETGLPVIRVGNSGVTGVISPSGRTKWLSEDEIGTPLVDARGCQLETVPVPLSPSKTPYTRFGDWPLLALFSLVTALIVYARFRPRS